MDTVLSFKADDRIAKLLENDAKKQFSSISAILRQIVYKHYAALDCIPPVKKTTYKATSSDSGPIPEGSGKDRRNVER